MKYCMSLMSLKNCLYGFHKSSRLRTVPYFFPNEFVNTDIGIYYIYLQEWFNLFLKGISLL